MSQIPRVILVDIFDPRLSAQEARQSQEELNNLVNTYGGIVIVKKIQKRQIPNYQTYIGSGKLAELKQDAIDLKADLLIFNNLLKPQQIYNVEKFFQNQIQVWDRVDLILKIFAKHAQTAEAKLQIELASLRHMGPRIFGMGMELSRQGGGIGTQGIGETNLEIMRRHLAAQEDKIKEKLQKIRKMHAIQRQSRQRKNLQTVAIVGYTNAGKSQLLNSLTQKGVKVKDELFATLDTRIGTLYLPHQNKICLLSDTIGFIQNLPPSLIDAFKSTLDETVQADLILHVIDYADKARERKIKVVNQILTELKTEQTPTIFVCNKIDLIRNLKTVGFAKKYARYQPVFVSALEKQGLQELAEKIGKQLT